jgi:ribosomal protein S18 acetylase RimI-like enzyme
MNRAPVDSTCARLAALIPADFRLLAQLADTIWRAHYTKIIGSAQVDYMLADRYTSEKLRLYLDADDRWLMLLRLDSRAVGYCSYALTKNPGEMKLEQLYLLQELQGQGLGRMMLRHVEEQARARGCRTLALQVNKQNDIAVAFYRKAGFAVREEAVFDIGNGFVMDDYVMEKAL